jgi:small subunit ribosomal protein S17
MSESATRGERKVREGYVVSDKMDKTIVVNLEDRGEAPAVRQGHPPDEQGQGARRGQHGRVGDRVRLMETRPLSATKRWRLVEILEKAK